MQRSARAEVIAEEVWLASVPMAAARSVCGEVG
jgi:hypothetical protein